MADNTTIVTSLDPAAVKVADDEVSYSGDVAKVQLVQLAVVSGAEGSRTLTKLGDLSVLTGAVNEAAPVSDTASSGLNGRLQRIAQRITSLIALIPTSLSAVGAFRVGSVNSSIAASIVIATSTTVGIVVDTDGARNLGLVVPSTFDGTQISFQVSADNATYYTLYDITNTQVVMTVAASRAYDLPGELMSWRYLKIITLTAQTTTDTLFLIVARS